MFTQKCFIRKNTKSLTDRLYAFCDRYCSGFWRVGDDTLLIAYSRCYGCDENNSISAEYLIKKGFIDCGTNEELFLAIAALRDDTDKDQVFMHQDGNFYKCECDSKIDMWGDFEESESYPRKATVSELIELFKK